MCVHDQGMEGMGMDMGGVGGRDLRRSGDMDERGSIK